MTAPHGLPHDRETWDAHYRTADALWSGDANPNLVSEVAELAPGRALDVGCGEGGDAVWLAERGWQVTALDISTVALGRGATLAGTRGDEVAARISWVQADLAEWRSHGRFDLVNVQYFHVAPDRRRVLLARLAEVVDVGGTLLVAAHAPSDLHTAAHRPQEPDRFYTADQAAESLDLDDWEVVVAEERPRPAKVHEGQDITVADTVLRARRRR